MSQALLKKHYKNNFLTCTPCHNTKYLVVPKIWSVLLKCSLYLTHVLFQVTLKKWCVHCQSQLLWIFVLKGELAMNRATRSTVAQHWVTYSVLKMSVTLVLWGVFLHYFWFTSRLWWSTVIELDSHVAVSSDPAVAVGNDSMSNAIHPVRSIGLKARHCVVRKQ